MLFNSFDFLVFFPLVAILYFLIPKNNYRNYFLLAASYYFYMGWKPEYALLLLSSTVLTYCASLAMARWNKYKKIFFVTGLFLNIGILFFFKYYEFVADNITTIMEWLGVKLDVPDFNVLLPVGISFYIFQSLGYQIDVYRGELKPVKNFFNYALFVSFFPQLVAGPIERSHNLLQQFFQKHNFDGEKAISGLNLMLWGYFLKLVVADRCSIYVDSVYNNMEFHNGGSMFLATFLFCFQLYGDFAGYSYIAIGCSRIMGFHLMDNFRRPYFFSVSIQDYWKRNHISLTTWFMDYIYYPMVGESRNVRWWYFSMFITFLLSGVWHGASWTYVICFAIHGFYLVICSMKEKRQKKFEKKYNLKKNEYWIWLNRIVTMFLVMFAMIFFRANSVHDAFRCIGAIFSNMSIPNIVGSGPTLAYSFLSIFILFLCEFMIEYKKVSVSANNSLRLYSICSISLIVVIMLFGVFDGGQFIYFQF